MSIVSCRGVTRSFARDGLEPLRAVHDVDLDIEAGEFVSIVGPSGSGKTTLLGLLGGLEPPDDGQIHVLGHDLARLSATERARLRQNRVGIVFQSFGLISSLRAGENVSLPLAFAGVGEADRRRRATVALQEVGLGGSVDARVDELSGWPAPSSSSRRSCSPTNPRGASTTTPATRSWNCLWTPSVAAAAASCSSRMTSAARAGPTAGGGCTMAT
jgi:predicted ABC-type transport system involved in lysophospholipase L1 biosynthesis ATPase subunit